MNIISEPDGKEIHVYGRFLDNTPATLRLVAGSHAVLMKSPGSADYAGVIDVPKSSKLTLKATFESER